MKVRLCAMATLAPGHGARERKPPEAESILVIKTK